MIILFDQTSPIPFHAIAAMIAVILGGIQLVMKKGSMVHRWLGRIWVSLMLIVSFSSFWIHEIKLISLYSPIHLLSLWTIFSCWMGIYFARKGNIKRHKYVMISLYFFALILTGFFTLMPGRVMHLIVFG